MEHRPWPVLLFGMALAASGAGPSTAQTPPQTDVGGQDGTLSDKLHNNNGVIHPQGDVDEGMQKPTPQAGPMPVVPPPGSPGGAPGAVPK